MNSGLQEKFIRKIRFIIVNQKLNTSRPSFLLFGSKTSKITTGHLRLIEIYENRCMGTRVLRLLK